MQKLMIIGNLVRDPESRTTNSGSSVCSFTVAVNRRGKQAEGQPEADFFRVSAWNKMGENCQKYLTKGKKVAVVGSVSVHTYQAQDGTTKASMEVFAQDVEFLSPIGGATEHTAPAPQGQPTDVTGQIDSELPF